MTLFQSSHQKYCNSRLNSLLDTAYFHTAARVIYLKCKWLITPLFKTLSRLPIILKINSKIFVTAYKARNNLLSYHFSSLCSGHTALLAPLNISSLFLLQDLCTCCSFQLEQVFPQYLLPWKAIPSEKTAVSKEIFFSLSITLTHLFFFIALATIWHYIICTLVVYLFISLLLH